MKTPIGAPTAPPATKGKIFRHSKPPRNEASETSWPSSAPNTASGAAVCGGSAQAQIDRATLAKAKPVIPCAKPAAAAPAATIRADWRPGGMPQPIENAVNRPGQSAARGSPPQPHVERARAAVGAAGLLEAEHDGAQVR